MHLINQNQRKPAEKRDEGTGLLKEPGKAESIGDESRLETVSET